MSLSKLGQCLGGVRTLEDLQKRCDLDEDTGCWHWLGAVFKGQPMVWMPDLSGTRNARWAARQLAGRPCPPGQRTFLACGERLCCNPGHVRCGSPKDVMRAAANRGSLVTSVRLASNKRTSMSRRSLTPEQAQEARESAEPGYIVAQRLGVSKSTVSKLRRGKTYRRDEIPGASVFSFLGGDAPTTAHPSRVRAYLEGEQG